MVKRTADVVPLFLIDGLDKATGLSPLAVELIHRCPDKAAVLSAFVCNLHISGGAISEIPQEIERRRELLRTIADNDDAVIADWLAEADRNLAAQIPYWENWSHDRDESFE